MFLSFYGFIKLLLDVFFKLQTCSMSVNHHVSSIGYEALMHVCKCMSENLRSGLGVIVFNLHIMYMRLHHDLFAIANLISNSPHLITVEI